METKGIKVIGKLLDHCFMQTGYVNMRVDRGRGGGGVDLASLSFSC